MSDKPDIRVELLSDPAYLSGARELISSVSKRIGFDDLSCSKIALAVDEALCNVIRHGYKYAENRPIWINLWSIRDARGEPLGIRLVIEDEAEQVDPAHMRGRDLDDVKPGGLGVHIIRDVMDEVLYEPREGVGMKLTMVKHIPRSDKPARLSCTNKGQAG